MSGGEQEYQRELRHQKHQDWLKTQQPKLGGQSAVSLGIPAQSNTGLVRESNQEEKQETGLSRPNTTLKSLGVQKLLAAQPLAGGSTATEGFGSVQAVQQGTKMITARLLQWIWKSVVGSYGLSLLALPFYFAIAYIGQLIHKGWCRFGEEWFTSSMPGSTVTTHAAGSTGAAASATRALLGRERMSLSSTPANSESTPAQLPGVTLAKASHAKRRIFR